MATKESSIKHRASCYGAIGELLCDGVEDPARRVDKGPSLIERTVHLAHLRGRWTQAREEGSTDFENEVAAEYIHALEVEVERHGIVIDRSEG